MYSFYRQALLSLALLGLAAGALAVGRDGECWILSGDTANPKVWPLLKESEDCARNQDFRRAAECLREVINLAASNQDIRAELDAEIPGGPLLLHVIAARVRYLGEMSRYSDYTIVEESRQALSNYAARAQGRQWDAYKRLYLAISFCFDEERNPHTNRVENLKALFLYDPLDPVQCFNGLHYNNWPAEQLRWVLDTYYAHGGRKEGLIPFFECKYQIRRGGTNALDEACLLLEQNPPAVLAEMFDAVSEALTNQSHACLARYRDALSNAALRLAPEQENVRNIAVIIDERRKVDAVLAGLPNP